MKSADMQRPVPVRETVDGDVYEYYPLGRHLVSAPTVLGGAPTFKYTRVEAAGVLGLLGAGWTVDQIVADYNRPELTAGAIEEAVWLPANAPPGLTASAARNLRRQCEGVDALGTT